MGLVRELQEAILGIAERVGPSTVGVGRDWSVGSGVIVAEGRVLTNAHNLRGDEATVVLADGRTASGRVLGADHDGDLALLEVHTEGLAPVTWDPGEAPAIGTPVFALANPGGRGVRVTFGLVSGTDGVGRGPRGRRLTGAIEHTAPLMRGSSGGPVVDEDGRLLGLNTARLDGGLILALPADAAMRERVEALGRGESRPRVRLGVGVAPARVARRLRRAVGLPERDGLLVRAVEPEGPAGRGGVRQGDLIVGAGGRPVVRLDDLHAALDAAGPGGRLSLAVVRGAEEREIAVTL